MIINTSQLSPLLRFYGIIFAVFFVMALITASLCFAAQKAWSKGLAEHTAAVLEKKYAGEFFVENFVPFASPFGMTGAAFSLATADGRARADKYAVITRVVTLYGPYTCVFLCDKNQDQAEFAGFTAMNENLEARFNAPMLKAQIAYWEKRISRMALRTASNQDSQ